MSKVETPLIIKKFEYSLRRYVNVDIEAMNYFALTYKEWVICANVQHWAEHTEGGYTFISRSEFAKLLGLSLNRTKVIIRGLVERGFLSRSKGYNLKAGKKWQNVQYYNGLQLPKDKNTKEESQEHTKPIGQFEDEFGTDEHSKVENQPSLNTVKKKAQNYAMKSKICTPDYAEEIAEDFWAKAEGTGWKENGNDIVDYFILLTRYMKKWIKNDEKLNLPKFEEREEKIVKPKNQNEMRLFFKQMGEEQRLEYDVTRNIDGTQFVVGFNSIGYPVYVELEGAYCEPDYAQKVYDHFLKNFDDVFGGKK